MRPLTIFLRIVLACGLTTSLLAGIPGSIDESFQPTVTDRIDLLLPVDDGVIAGGADGILKFDTTGQRDLTFTPAIENNFFLYALERDAQGRILVGGELGAGDLRGVLYRLLPNGEADPSFNTVRADGRITSVLELPDSKLLVAGYFSTINGASRPGIARLSSTGELDPAFAPTTDGVWHEAVALMPDGDYFAGGQGLRRYRPDGTYQPSEYYGDSISFSAKDILVTPEGGLWIASSFSNAKILADRAVDISYTNEIWPTIHAAAVLPDGRILIGGNDPGNSLDDRFSRYFADGREDPFFDPFLDDEVLAVAPGPDETAYIAGRRTNFDPFLLRIFLQDTNASTEIQFNRQSAAVGEGNSIPLTILRDGDASGAASVRFATRAATAIAGADFAETNGIINFAPGERFKTISIATVSDSAARTNRTFEVVLTEAEGAFISANSLVLVTILDRDAVAVTTNPARAYSEIDGAIQFNFSRTGALAYPMPVHWRIEPAGPASSNMFAALEGEARFTALEELAFINLRINDDAQAGTNKTFTITFTSPDPRLTLNRSNDITITVVENDRSGDPGRGVDDHIDHAAFHSDGRLVIAGNFFSVNGTARPQLARLLPTGEVDPAFVPPTFDVANQAIRGLVPLPDGKVIVMGSFTKVAGQDRKYLARLNENGSVDETFDPSSAIPSQPYAVTGTADGGVLVLGLGLNFNGIATNQSNPFIRTNLGPVVRLDASGAKDTNLATRIRVSTSIGNLIAPAADGGFYVAGDISVYTNAFTSAFPSGQPVRRYLARFLENGAWDTNFNAVVTGGAFPNFGLPLITSLSVGIDGDVLLTGNLGTVNGVPVQSIARFNPDGSLDRTFTTNAASILRRDDAYFNAVFTPGGQVLCIIDTRFAGMSAVRLNADGTVAQWITSFPNYGPGPLPSWQTAPDGTAFLANAPSIGLMAWFYPDGTHALDAAVGLSELSLLPTGEIQLRVEGRTTGELVLQRTSDFSTWQEILRQPLAAGFQTITLPPPASPRKTFLRALVID